MSNELLAILLNSAASEWHLTQKRRDHFPVSCGETPKTPFLIISAAVGSHKITLTSCNG